MNTLNLCFQEERGGKRGLVSQPPGVKITNKTIIFVPFSWQIKDSTQAIQVLAKFLPIEVAIVQVNLNKAQLILSHAVLLRLSSPSKM